MGQDSSQPITCGQHEQDRGFERGLGGAVLGEEFLLMPVVIASWIAGLGMGKGVAEGHIPDLII